SYVESDEEFDALRNSCNFLLEVFSDKDFVIAEELELNFVGSAITIANIMHICGMNTDSALQKAINDDADVAKLLTLYTYRNTIELDLDKMFKLKPELSSMWWSSVMMMGGVDAHSHKKKRQLLTADAVLQNYVYCQQSEDSLRKSSSRPYFYCTYIDHTKDRLVKGTINQAIQKLVPPASLSERPDFSKIAVLGRSFLKEHATYSSLSLFLYELKEDYHITLLFPGSTVAFKDRVDHNLFDEDTHVVADKGYTLVNSVGNNFTNGRIDLLTETGYGFSLSDSDRTYFNNITVSGHGRGILIQKFSNDVLMHELNISTIREGLYVTHSGGFVLENSRFSGGALPIYIDDIEQWLPENRINFVNITTPWQGMFVSDNRGNLVIENSLIKTNLTSLQFVSSSSITMRYNEISSYAEDGLRVLMTQGIHAINNKFHSEQACGVLILQPRSIGNAENLFEQNDITGACGVRINSDDFQRFSNNNITGLTEDAIFVDVLNSNTEFSNNRVTGTITGPIAFEIEMGFNRTLGDTLEVVYLNVESLIDTIDLHYQFDDLAPSITQGSQIFLGIPNVDNLAIWTEVSGGNGNLNMFRIDVAIGIGKEFVNPIVSTTNQTEFEFESGEAFVLVGTAIDSFPATYLVYVDGEKIDELEFLQETAFRIPLIFIELGVHTVVLDFIDSSGNIGSIEYIITIIDTTPPELTVVQEFTFVAGQSPQTIEFQASDLHLDTYTVIMNGVVLVVEVLTSTTGSFSLAPYNLEAGTYEFQISINDTSGNIATAVVTINIVDPIQTTSDTSLSTSDSLTSGLLFIQLTFVTMMVRLMRRKNIRLKLN
ncbi:MAG: right-handed parallel beta-helix repeat-containing protein, partial [Candidatus Heimdallarchaeota archaeon]|nr:right-handed parallel beta-helix repeat-containing protein [Candidatus Heimdallarchaeota archaeon]